MKTWSIVLEKLVTPGGGPHKTSWSFNRVMLLILLLLFRIISAISVKYYKAFLAHSCFNEGEGVYNCKRFSCGIQSS